MKENQQKNEPQNVLLAWYQEIPRSKRNKFLLALQLKFGMSQAGLYDKLKKDNWLPYQREMVESVINDGTWEE